MKKISQINIFLGNPKEKEDVADALKIIAENIENGYVCGIAGWSDVSWNIDFSEENDEEEEEND